VAPATAVAPAARATPVTPATAALTLAALLLLFLILLLGACSSQPTAQTISSNTMLETPNPKTASAQTTEANAEVYALLDFGDETEREFAERGFIAAPENLEIKDKAGNIVWSQDAYGFLEDVQEAQGPQGAPSSPEGGIIAGGDSPKTVNPSLLRNTTLNHLFGLYKVSEGIYQVRGYDMANITFIEGESGWIVFDPLMSVECAQAAKELVDDELGVRPVVAIVYSHPHVDHYGGVKGVISAEEVAERSVPIIAPAGFAEHAVSENLYAGTAMGRRAEYQYGTFLTPGLQGSLSIGIGMGQSLGTVSYIPPNDSISASGETRTIDGIAMEFQMTPGTEAPAEMNVWFADKKALWMAENCTATLHNLYTLRGAPVRDGNAWAGYLMETLALYGDEAEVVFQSHNWPHWGNGFIRDYLIDTAAVYKFINDQTLLYINQGYTSSEIAAMISLPPDLAQNWYTRQYYGTVAHNSRAVYQRFMGYYDANPVNLNPLPPDESAKKLVEYLGNTEAVLQKAREDYAKGEYQWVAQITNILVYAEPENKEARLLCADALEQLAYQAESGTWRNAYLSGAYELRNGASTTASTQNNGDLQAAMTPEMTFDYMGILLDTDAAQDLDAEILVKFTDGEPYLITLRCGVLLYQANTQATEADVTVTMPRSAVSALMLKDSRQRLRLMEVEGDSSVLDKLAAHLVTFDGSFNIIEP
jgi:alkyl sulfatase BDS1-like metallo-beta-lactamase superfamily hydrolase